MYSTMKIIAVWTLALNCGRNWKTWKIWDSWKESLHVLCIYTTTKNI
jgi:hypothetical protein